MGQRRRWTAFLAVASLPGSACAPREAAPPSPELVAMATNYAAAWSSGSPDRLAAFYAETGTLQVNGGAPSVGRPAIQATAASYMTAFPDMVVQLDSVTGGGSAATFYWTWTGTNTGPGGTGKAVRLRGYEEWTLDAGGLIAQSLGHFDEAEYQRQLQEGAPPPLTGAPASVSMAQFRSLSWLLGRWRGAEQGGALFFEGYVLLDSTTVASLNYPNSTFAAPSDSGRLALRGDTLFSGSPTMQWVASAIDSMRVVFVPWRGASNSFAWERTGPGHWTATLAWDSAGVPRHRIYYMEAVR